MKIAMPLKNSNKLDSELSEHFGHASYFGFVEIQDGKIVNYEIIANTFESHGPGDLPNLIKQKNAEILIAYGMGQRALDFFESYNIKVITGVEGSMREIVEEYIKGNLEPDESWKDKEEFAHHDHED
ncbi:MAG: NifB/NifX family molybdenum-iron cluster-binding protein [Thermoplasmata archaeon]